VATTEPTPQRAQPFDAPRALLADWGGLVLALGLLIVVFGLAAPHFFSAATFRTIANQVPDALLVAVGMTFVLLIGGIDLSVGSVLALSGAVLGVALGAWHLPLIVAVPLCLTTGALCGMANGATTVRFALPSFIVTLGMLEMARGAAYLVTGGRTQYIGSSVQAVGEISLLGLSLPFLLALAAVVLGQLALSRTVWGRYVRAVGANEEATRLSGVATGTIKISVFALCGALSGLAALVNASRLASADPNAGTGFELQAIAAVVIGGTSLLGGRGSVARSFFGVVLIAVLGNGLAQIGAQEPVKRLVTGAVIVLAVILDYYRRRGERAGR